METDGTCWHSPGRYRNAALDQRAPATAGGVRMWDRLLRRARETSPNEQLVKVREKQDEIEARLASLGIEVELTGRYIDQLEREYLGERGTDQHD